MSLHQTVTEKQSLKTSHSHGGVVQTDHQLNVPQNCEVSGWHAGMPAQHLTDVGFDSRPRPCFQVYSVGSVMGNRLADCAVGGITSTTAAPPQSVPAVVVTGSYRNCSQWSPAHASSAVLQHGRATDWLSGQQSAYDVNRPVWVGQRSPATMNGTDNSQSNYGASQAYAQRGSGQMPSMFLPTSIPAAPRLHAVNIPANMPIRQIWMQPRPQQQQRPVVIGAGQASVSLSPVQNRSMVGVGLNNVSPVIWPPRFASPSLTSAQLSVPSAHVTAAAAQCTSVASVVDSRLIAGPSPPAASVSDGSMLRTNTVGRIYQLPVASTAATSVQCDTCVASSTMVSPSESVMTSAQSTVSIKSAVKPAVKSAVITSSPESEQTYVAGRRYTITKEDGVTVEGIWDGKYLTVPPTSVAKSTASQTSGQSVWYVYCSAVVIAFSALMLLVCQQEEHLARKNLSDELLACLTVVFNCSTVEAAQ